MAERSSLWRLAVDSRVSASRAKVLSNAAPASPARTKLR